MRSERTKVGERSWVRNDEESWERNGEERGVWIVPDFTTSYLTSDLVRPQCLKFVSSGLPRLPYR